MLLARASIAMSTYGITTPSEWMATEIEFGPQSSTFVVVGPGLRFAATSPLPGQFNVSNTLAAIASAALAGLDPEQVAVGIAGADGVPGRLESVNQGQDFTVVVDYAHKPDAVAAVLGTLRPLTKGRVIVVIGAGGDRDKGKRPIMGEIAAQLADLVIVTDDNPRTEDPAAIRTDQRCPERRRLRRRRADRGQGA